MGSSFFKMKISKYFVLILSSQLKQESKTISFSLPEIKCFHNLPYKMWMLDVMVLFH